MLPKRILLKDHKNTCWPDIKPKNSMVGMKYCRLTYTQPVGFKFPRWYYLAECECGNEVIVSAKQARSCGCLEKNNSKHKVLDSKSYDDETKSPFDRFKTCTRGNFQCVHYVECLDDRLYNGRIESKRYKPGCYTPSKAEIQLESSDDLASLRIPIASYAVL